MKNWTELIGNRVLVKLDFWSSTVHEYVIWDVSPSGDWVELKHGRKTFWHEANRLKLIENLDRKDGVA